MREIVGGFRAEIRPGVISSYEIREIGHTYHPIRVLIVNQWVPMHAERARIEAIPNKRFQLICHICGSKGLRVHTQEKRSVGGLNFASARVCIQCLYRKREQTSLTEEPPQDPTAQRPKTSGGALKIE